jgi:hypothetical protein
MRSYIFTEHEKNILVKWLSGEKVPPRQVDRILDVVRGNEQSLLADVKLLVWVVRKLRVIRKFRR